MRLFLFTATDDCDIEGNLDWFVVAPDAEAARELWKAAVESHREEEGRDSEIRSVFVVLDDVAGTRYEGEARFVPWEELEDVA